MKKYLIGFLAGVCIVGCFAGGYYIGKNIGKSKEEKPSVNENTKKESKTVNYVLTDAKVKDAENILSSIFEEPFDYFKLRELESKNVTSPKAFRIAFNDLTNNNCTGPDNAPKSITLSEIETRIKKYLGSDYVFDPNSKEIPEGYGDSYQPFTIGCFWYEYNNSTKTFDFKTADGCGGLTIPEEQYKLVKAYEKDNIMTLEYKAVYVDFENDYIYSDSKHNNIIGKLKDSYNSLDTITDEYFAKGETYKVTFKNNGDYYTFISSKLVK